MCSILKTPLAVLATSVALSGAAYADDLSGTLRIFSDMSNPAPRAIIEELTAEFDAMHPDLSVELTVIDR